MSNQTLKNKVKQLKENGVELKTVSIDAKTGRVDVGYKKSGQVGECVLCGKHGLAWFMAKYLCLDFQFNYYNYQNHFYILSTDKNYCEKVSFKELSEYIFKLVSKAIKN